MSHEVHDQGVPVVNATGTLTITDFLLARITEDEAAAGSYHRLLCMRTACDSEGCVWDEQERMADERVCTCGYPARVLAECKAKRAIVGNHDGERSSTTGDYCATEDGRYEIPCPDLRYLATVYASHPDYDPAWAPE